MMNHAILRLCRVLAVVLVIATAVPFAHAEPQVVREPVKLRSGDSMQSPVLRVLRRKTRVETLGDVSSKTGYVRVRTRDGQEGWVFADYLKPVAPPSGRPTVAAATCGVHCGVERWPVKTVTDADANEIDETPKTATVSELRNFDEPDDRPQSGRAGDVERTVYRVDAKLKCWKGEDDGDLHLVLTDLHSSQKTMIVEIPDRDCQGACSSKFADQFQAARDTVTGELGDPPSSCRTLSPMRRVTVTGVGFFDFKHGQTGVAPNGIELHPVLAIEFKD
jgi:hypothetical protein